MKKSDRSRSMNQNTFYPYTDCQRLLLIVFSPSKREGHGTDSQGYARDDQRDARIVIAFDTCFGRDIGFVAGAGISGFCWIHRTWARGILISQSVGGEFVSLERNAIALIRRR